MNFADMKNEDIRLVILDALRQDPDYSINEYILSDVLDIFGHKISRDNLRTHLAWLQEQGLVNLNEVAGVCAVAKITARGADVARGAVVVPGVKRPRPEA